MSRLLSAEHIACRSGNRGDRPNRPIFRERRRGPCVHNCPSSRQTGRVCPTPRLGDRRIHANLLGLHELGIVVMALGSRFSSLAHGPCSWALVFAGCASLPKQRYGVDRITISGNEASLPEAILTCMTTHERDKLELGLGALGAPECGRPPFDKHRFAWRMFAWPWTPWPVYDEAVMRLDIKRVERWFQARGYYGARVLSVDLRPPEAENSDLCTGEDCKVSIDVKVEEGSPVRIQSVESRATSRSSQAARAVRKAMTLCARDDLR